MARRVQGTTDNGFDGDAIMVLNRSYCRGKSLGRLAQIDQRVARAFGTLVCATALLLGLTGVNRASAQQLANTNPNALRAPEIVSLPLSAVRQQVIQLFFTELERAARSGDTIALAALVPDSVIPAAERATAVGAGCASLRAATDRLRARSTLVGAASPVTIHQVDVISAGQGDTVSFGRARLVAGAWGSDISVALTTRGHARGMARVQGVLLGFCTVPM